jgi:hypothetical protein
MILVVFVAAMVVSTEAKNSVILDFLSTGIHSPFVIPITVRACLVNKSPINVENSLVEQTLMAIQSSRVPRFLDEDASVEGVIYVYSYSSISSPRCEEQADLVLTIEIGATGKEKESRSYVSDQRVSGVIRASSSMGSGELAGRVAGWIVSATNAWLAPDLTRKLFFSLVEDDGVEVSIVGFHRANDKLDPLDGLFLPFIREHIREWVGIEDNKTIVKATTRDLADHPGVLAALLRSKETHTEESYDPVTGRFSSTPSGGEEIDPAEFVKGVAESSDALFRAGTAARLVKLRRREVEVYVLVAQSENEAFRGRTRLYVTSSDIAVLIPRNVAESRFNLTEQIMVGIADCLTGVTTLSKQQHFEMTAAAEKNGGLPKWMQQRAIANVALNELHRTLKSIRESLVTLSEHGGRSVDLDVLVSHLEVVRNSILIGKWTDARSQLRGAIRDNVRNLARLAKLEKKNCCVKQLVQSEDEPRGGRRMMFLIIYGFVGIICILAVIAMMWMGNKSSSTSSNRDLAALFGRQHLD